MHQRKLKPLVIDSSTWIALERTNLLEKFLSLKKEKLMTEAVRTEIRSEKIAYLDNILKGKIRGRAIKKLGSLLNKGFGKGEAESLVLAYQLKTELIISDDRKIIQRKYLMDKELQKITVSGFSFLLDLMAKEKIINDVWFYFDEITKKNNWKDGEVRFANMAYLRDSGY